MDTVTLWTVTETCSGIAKKTLESPQGSPTPLPASHSGVWLVWKKRTTSQLFWSPAYLLPVSSHLLLLPVPIKMPATVHPHWDLDWGQNCLRDWLGKLLGVSVRVLPEGINPGKQIYPKCGHSIPWSEGLD